MKIDPLDIQAKIKNLNKELAPMSTEWHSLSRNMAKLEEELAKLNSALLALQKICIHKNTENDYINHGRVKWVTCLDCGFSTHS